MDNEFIIKEDVDRILDAADGKLISIANEFITLTKARTGDSYTAKCPMCGEEKGLVFSEKKQAFSCFKCKNIKGKGALSFLMGAKDYTYPNALHYLAENLNIILHEKEVTQKKVLQKQTKKQAKENRGEHPDSYCFKMLTESGLTPADVTANVYKTGDNKSVFQLRTFRPGTLDPKGNIVAGDDAIIEYYDLEGMPVMYDVKDAKGRLTNKMKEYYRVRWQHPAEHLDKAGKPYKYKSPSGGGTPIYIPERIRAMYKAKTEIPRLYIQEGEKKAEKGCKHGIPSIAISGIQNLGNKNSGLPEDLIRIIDTCMVKDVVFIMDSDWNDISNSIKINDNVQQRPLNFYYAVRNYRDYMKSLVNRNIWVEIYAGHINKNEAQDKGLDDLLANTLAGKEDDLIKDIDILINEKNLTGKYVQLFKITTCTEHKLQELWSLQSPQKFAEAHRDILVNLPEFKIGKHKWRFDESGVLESAQPIESDEQFWQEVDRKKNGVEYTDYEFKYVRARTFLQNRGFGRFRRLDDSYQFIRLDPPVVSVIDASDARDYLFEFAEANCNEAVNEMISKGVSQYVGPDKLSLLRYIEPSFIKASSDTQYFYFKTNCWEITANSVKEVDYSNIRHHIWSDQQKKIPAKYLQVPMVSFTKDAQGNYDYTLSELGKQCHYLRFLENTSNFTWRKEQAQARGESVNITDLEIQENKVNLLSKLCAIGYMMMECKNASVTKAVIGMDGKQSEVGESNGRSGKSLLGELFRAVSSIAYINGKQKDMFSDSFLWNDIVEKTKIVFIDDVLQGFKFESLFPFLTGDWSVNYKGGKRMTFPFTKSPKIYIATNHSINGSGTSFSDRQWLLAFSDFYNSSHKPKDDFGCDFFRDWDFDQWNLCWNLLADCVQLYLRYGVVEAPGERLEARILRQEITEGFIAWADEYFSSDENRNRRIPRKTLSDLYFEYDPLQRKYVSPTEFKKRFVKFCQWKGYTFNPSKYDPVTGLPNSLDKDGRAILDDKSGGVEYFTVGNGTAEIEVPQDKLAF